MTILRNIVIVVSLLSVLYASVPGSSESANASPVSKVLAGSTTGTAPRGEAPATPSVSTAIWIFSDEVSSPLNRNALVQASLASQINVWYISVYQPTENSAGRRMYEDADIAALITDAHARGIQVWATYSTYEWTSLGCSQTGVPLQRMQEVQAYNASHPASRFDGVMLDLELENPQVSEYQQLLGLHRCIRDAVGTAGLRSGTAISAFWEIAVPFPESGPSRPVYQHIFDMNFDHVVIMGYRNFAGTTCGGAQSNGVVCLVETEVAYARSTGQESRVLLGLDTDNCTPGCGPASVTVFDMGQSALNQIVGQLNQYFPDLGGIAIHRYKAAYLSGSLAWPASNPLFPSRGGTGVGAVVPTPTSVPAGTTQPTAGSLHFVSPPIRVVDTRPGTKLGLRADGTPIAPGPLPAESTTQFKVGGATLGGSIVPGDLTGVLLNVTIVQSTPSGGFVTVFSGDGPRPTASTVNPGLGVNANLAITAVSRQPGTVDTVAVHSVGGSRDVLIDLVGYYRVDVATSVGTSTTSGSTGNLRLVAPVRVLDTRSAAANGVGPVGFRADGTSVGAAPLSPGQASRFQLAGRSFGDGPNAVTFPSDTTGVLAHVTTVQARGSGGFVTLLPGDWGIAGASPPPATSTVNPVTAVAFNTTAVGIPSPGSPGAGTFSIFSTNQLDLAVDVVGYFAPSNTLDRPGVVGNPTLITPTRVVDTRPSDATAAISTTGVGPTGTAIAPGPITAGSVQRFLIAGRRFGSETIPADVKGVLLNVTTVQDRPGGGFVVIFPGHVATPPNASATNPSTSVAASAWATALAPPSTLASGGVSLYSSGESRDVLVDVIAYFR